MRTTLKRGIGRGAEVNGNGGRSSRPGALSPVTLYRQPPPAAAPACGAGRPLLRSGSLVLVLMLVAGLVGGFYLWAHESAAALRPHSIDAKRAQTRLDAIPDAHQPAIALVIGYDHRAGDGT